MKRIYAILILIIILIPNISNVDPLLGALIGGGIGQAVGRNTGSTVAGALIGTVVGGAYSQPVLYNSAPVYTDEYIPQRQIVYVDERRHYNNPQHLS